MNNEEKILAILENMDGRLSALEKNVSLLKEDVSFTKSLVLKFENEDFPNLRTSVEGFENHDDKLYDHERRITKLETA